MIPENKLEKTSSILQDHSKLRREDVCLIESLVSDYSYEPTTGTVISIKTKKVLGYKDDDCFVKINTAKGKSLKKMKYSVLCWILITKNIVPKDHVVYFKNFDVTDYSMLNLKLVTKKEMSVIRACIKNLEGSLKIVPHKKDVFKVEVQYIGFNNDGGVKFIKFDDEEMARRRLNTIRSECIKTLAKHAITY